jgi:hypothetical protein
MSQSGLLFATALPRLVLLLNEYAAWFQATRTSPEGASSRCAYGPCGMPQPLPPTFPTSSAPGNVAGVELAVVVPAEVLVSPFPAVVSADAVVVAAPPETASSSSSPLHPATTSDAATHADKILIEP